MKILEFTGRTVEDAVNAGLKELGAKLDDVTVTVIKHPGFFTKAVIGIEVHGEIAEKLDNTTAESLISKIEKRAVSGELSTRPPAYKGDRPRAENEKMQGGAPSRMQPPQRTERTPDNAFKAKTENAVRQENTFKPRQENAGAAKPENTAKPPEFVKKHNAFGDTAKGAPEKKEPSKFPEKPRVPVSAAELETARVSAEGYLGNVLKLMGAESALKVAAAGDEVNIEIVSDNNQLIGYRGEILDSLEYLTMLAAGSESRVKVNLDCGGYREKRTVALIELAKRLAEKAVRTGRKVDLEPMSSLNRKIIHSALADNDAVFTRSEGHEPNRYLVIIPKKAAAAAGSNGKKNNKHRRKNGGSSGGGQAN